jgi:predicted nucleic-acid-binding Zn-ribbon protein
MNTRPAKYACAKCGATHKVTGEIRASGGFWSSFFDVSTRRFTYVSCGRCGHTELYNQSIGTGSKILDFLGSG